MRDDEDVLVCGRLAVPAVRQVEQPPSDHVRRRVGVVARHEVGRGLGAARFVGAAGQAPADLAAAQPVEQRSHLVVVVGDEPVQGNRSRAHDRRAHSRPLVVEDSASLQMYRMPRVVVVENELLAGGGAVESELARWYDLGA